MSAATKTSHSFLLLPSRPQCNSCSADSNSRAEGIHLLTVTYGLGKVRLAKSYFCKLGLYTTHKMLESCDVKKMFEE